MAEGNGEPTVETATPRGASDTVCGWVTLLTGLAVSGYLLWRNQQGMDFSEFNLLNIAYIFWIPLLVILLGLRRSAEDFGLTVGQLKKGTLAALGLFALFIPVILFFAPKPGPQQYYLGWMGPNSGSGAIVGIFWERDHWSLGGKILWERLLYHQVAMGFYMFAWEWYHRGFLLWGLRRIMPAWVAVLVQAILFTALHWGKPPEEVASSFPGGLLMGALALRYGSFIPCFLLHWLVSAGFDFAVLYYHFRQ